MEMMNWYWNLRRKIYDRVTRRDREIERLRRDINMIMDCLEAKRVALFLKMVKYEKGMSLHDDRPRPISLEDLEKRIANLERSR